MARVDPQRGQGDATTRGRTGGKGSGGGGAAASASGERDSGGVEADGDDDGACDDPASVAPSCLVSRRLVKDALGRPIFEVV